MLLSRTVKLRCSSQYSLSKGQMKVKQNINTASRSQVQITPFKGCDLESWGLSKGVTTHTPPFHINTAVH